MAQFFPIYPLLKQYGISYIECIVFFSLFSASDRISCVMKRGGSLSLGSRFFKKKRDPSERNSLSLWLKNGAWTIFEKCDAQFLGTLSVKWKMREVKGMSAVLHAAIAVATAAAKLAAEKERRRREQEKQQRKKKGK